MFALFCACGRAPRTAAKKYYWRCFNIGKELQINDAIRDREIRVVASDGTQLGIMSLLQAKNMAFQQNLDLVKIAPQATPPVCKIMDYGKYRFEQAKREKEARKNQHTVEIKEIRLSLGIDTHDFNTKMNHALRFLGEGNKVKVSIRMRSRQNIHPEFGFEVMNKFFDKLGGTAKKDEKGVVQEGRNILMILSPVKPK